MPIDFVLRLRLFSLAILVVGAAFAMPAQAGNVGEVIDFSIPQQYLSPRAAGMGNAFVGLADDYNAIFYNPAGLARIEESEINMGITGMLDTKVVKLKNDIGSVSGSDNVSDITNLLSQNYGNVYAARVGLGGILSHPRWALAIIPVDLSLDMGIHQLGAASLDLIATQDTTIAYARGWDVKWFQEDRMSLGVTGKAIYRGYYNRSFLAPDLIGNSSLLRVQDAREGFTVDADFGMLWTPKVRSNSFWRYLRPTFGATVRNIADYGFTSNFHLIDKNSANDPAKLGRRFDLGSVWELPDWWIFKTRALADMRDMGYQNFTIRKGTHLGAEFLWKIRSWWQGGWRVGINQGYFTAGFTGKFAIFNLDLVTYAEEVGPSDAPKASRRFMAKASLDW